MYCCFGGDHLVEAVRVGVAGSLLVGPAVVLGEVPLADQAGSVAQRAQHLGDGGEIRGQRGATGGRLAPQEVGDAGPGRVEAGHQRGPVGRAHRRGGVRLGEAHALAGQRVDGRGLVERVAVAAELVVAEVVDGHHDHVRLAGSPARWSRSRRLLDRGQRGRSGAGRADAFQEGTAARLCRHLPNLSTSSKLVNNSLIDDTLVRWYEQQQMAAASARSCRVGLRLNRT